MNNLMALPKCPIHNSDMMFRPASTSEQKFCGAWYECAISGCVCSTLIPSSEVLTHTRLNHHKTILPTPAKRR